MAHGSGGRCVSGKALRVLRSKIWAGSKGQNSRVDLTESRSRAFFRRADDSRAARESSTRAYASRRGKPEVRGASRVAQRALGASL